MRIFIFGLLAACLTIPLARDLNAQVASSLIFRKDTIYIIPPAPVVVQQVEGQAPAQPPEPPRAGSSLSVDIRSQEALKLEWMHALNRLKKGEGVMVTLDQPLRLPLMQLSVSTALDVIVIDAQGVVDIIAPTIMLSQLTQEILPSRPAKAYLYVNAGEAKRLDIRPGDQVEHAVFSPAPTIQK